jgi:sec-independent protein translocase protein TatB
MFEFDAGKLIIIGIVALIVIGPKELPRVMRHVGEALAKMRRMGADFRSQFLEAMREAEFDDIKSGVEKVAAGTKLESGADPLAQIKAEITQALEAAEKPGSFSATAAASLTAPQKGPETPHGTAAPALTAMPGGENLTAVESNNLATASLHGPAPSGTMSSGMRALADALTNEISVATPAPEGAGLEKAPENR